MAKSVIGGEPYEGDLIIIPASQALIAAAVQDSKVQWKINKYGKAVVTGSDEDE